jgi:hypothetical protein
MFGWAIYVRLAGNLDPGGVNALRAALRLTPEGRYGDDWDQILGRRTDEVPGGRLQILLYREDSPGPWAVHINAEGEPSPAALSAVEQEITEAVRDAGLAVAGVSRRD